MIVDITPEEASIILQFLDQVPVKSRAFMRQFISLGEKIEEAQAKEPPPEE